MAQVHESRLQTPYYEFIRDGIKTFEIRVFREKQQGMKVGDIWSFSHNDHACLPTIRVVITEIKVYGNFREAVVDTDLAKLLPQVTSLEEAVLTYEGFGNYKENSKKYGVVRFSLSLC